MATLVKQDGRYYLQFYSTHRSPKRKKIALGTSRKRPAKRKQRELEDIRQAKYRVHNLQRDSCIGIG